MSGKTLDLGNILGDRESLRLPLQRFVAWTFVFHKVNGLIY